jgi:hypothetical protein
MTRFNGFFILLGFCLICRIPAGPLRSLDELFPGLGDDQKMKAFSEEGFNRPFKKDEARSIVPNPDSGIDLFSVVMEKEPSHFIEALMVVPYNGRSLDIPEAYNALGRIGDIKNHSYFNRSRNTRIQVFEESTRIESAEKTRPIPDPPPTRIFPASEEIFLLLKDRNFGNIYVRGDLTLDRYGLTFILVNYKTIRYFLFPVMRAEKLCAVLYIEPLEEGLLVYGMAAVDIPDFIASRINISSSVERRLSIFISWFREGLKNTG